MHVARSQASARTSRRTFWVEINYKGFIFKAFELFGAPVAHRHKKTGKSR